MTTTVHDRAREREAESEAKGRLRRYPWGLLRRTDDPAAVLTRAAELVGMIGHDETDLGPNLALESIEVNEFSAVGKATVTVRFVLFTGERTSSG